MPHVHALAGDGADEQAVIQQARPPSIELAGYQVTGLLGQGGFGAVFSAIRVRDGHPVAIKVARQDRHTANARLLRETEVLEAIGSPHVPAVHDRGVLPGGAAYVVMEHIQHPTLAQLMERAAPLAPAECSDIVQALLRSLSAVHRAGFTHRDLKPENIFWNRAASQVTLIDFSLGRAKRAGFELPNVTKTGVMLGTVEYMAPEQCEPGAAIDHRADIYAVGVLIYELLTGHPPFWGAPKSVRLAHQVRRPPQMNLDERFPATIEEVVMRLLAKEPGQRYPSADAALVAVRQAMADELPSAPTRTRHQRSQLRSMAMEMPVVYFRSTHELGAVQQALARYGCTLANMQGDRFAAVLAELSGESPVERASMAAEGLLEMGVCTAATVDFTNVTRRVGPDGSLRHRSAAFSREHLYPERSDAGVLRTDEAEQALPTRVEVPFFGREDLLDALSADIACAVEQRTPTISTVIGPGGYGKSALGRRLHELVTRMYPGARVFSMRASPPLTGEARATLRRLLEWVFELHDMGVGALHSRELREFLGESLAAELAPALALGMGWVGPEHPLVRDAAAAPGALRASTFRLLGEGLRRRAARDPLLIILDDAHMADDSTLDGLEYATFDGLDLPIWVCALARDSFESARPSFGARAGRRQRLALDKLDEPSAAALCRELLKPAEDVPERVVQSLVWRSQAIPLLLVEMVQGLKRDRIVRRHKANQVWFVASDEFDRRSGMPLLTWLAQSELSALPKDLAAHAQLAALLGDGFRTAELALVMRELEHRGLGAEFPLDATAGLNNLRALGMLVRDAGGRLRFRHVLLREAIEQMIPQARRGELHRAAYRAYCALSADGAGMDDERRARIAYHAARAGANEHAMRLYLELAEQARLSHDYITAERHYTRALELVDERDEANRMRTFRGRALMRYRVGRYLDSLDDFARARELAVRRQDKEAEIEILLDEATALDWIDRHQQSSKQVFRAQLTAVDVPHSRLIDARLHLGVGRAYWRAALFERGDERESRLARAREKLEQTIPIAEEHGPEGYETLISSYLILGCVLAAMGEISQASQVFERAVALCEERGDLFHLAAAIINRRSIWIARGDIEQIEADAERCIEIGREIGIIGFEFSALYHVAELRFQRGDLERAWPYVRRAVRCEEQRKSVVGAGRPLAVLLEARMLCYEGRYRDARERWQRVCEHNERAIAERDRDRELKPSEKVLLDMVDLSTRDATLAEWERLLADSERLSIDGEASEVIEMMGIWARSRNNSELAGACFERALAKADTGPAFIKQRILSQLGLLETPSTSSLHARLER